MNNRKKKGLRMLPCGSPRDTGRGSDSVPLTLVHSENGQRDKK